MRAARLQDATWTPVAAAARRRSRASRPAPARCGRRSRSRPRATRWRPGATGPVTAPRGCGAPHHRPQPVGRSRRLIAGGGSVRLAGHRHRGRRLVRLGRLPAGLRRRLAHVRAAARRLAVRGAGGDRRRARLQRAARGHERARRRLRRLAGVARARRCWRSWLDHDHFQPAARLDSVDSGVADQAGGGRDRPQRHRDRLAHRRHRTRARFKDAEAALGPEFTISRPEFGAVADPGVFISGDRVGDFAVAMVQVAPGRPADAVGRALRPPAGRAVHRVLAGLQAPDASRAALAAGARAVGHADVPRVHGRRADRPDARTTRSSRPRRSRPGQHTWQVEAVDQAGQTARSRVRTLRIDSLPPTLSVTRHRAARGAGETLKITARATDTGGAGMDHVTVDYGDRSPTTRTHHHAPSLQARALHAQGRGRRQGRQRHAQASQAADPERDPARRRPAAGARRPAAADGHPQRDARLVLGRARGDRSQARLARGRALLAAGADLARRRRRVGARRPPGGAGGRGDRARGGADRGAGRRRRAGLRRHLQAGGRGGGDRGRRGDRQRRLRAARPGAGRGVRARRRGAGAHAHARGAEGHAARSRHVRRRGRRRRRVPARADGGRASRRGWTRRR